MLLPVFVNQRSQTQDIPPSYMASRPHDSPFCLSLGSTSFPGSTTLPRLTYLPGEYRPPQTMFLSPFATIPLIPYGISPLHRNPTNFHLHPPGSLRCAENAPDACVRTWAHQSWLPIGQIIMKSSELSPNTFSDPGFLSPSHLISVAPPRQSERSPRPRVAGALVGSLVFTIGPPHLVLEMILLRYMY